ncbi:MAG: hypothetical protein BMS9Abin08_0566 [Gammaproteobacteria bacterium]|nr:MAG: hypothetical protein BMS9Abin08_0566 [Gammaproteobacteria bacterium]
MGIRKRKPVVTPARAQQQPQPIDSAYAAEVRRRTEELAKPVEKTGENGGQVRSHQRQQAGLQMAKLRSETVRARRLAEHIENLSQEAVAYKHKRKQVMTDTTIVDPGHAQRLRRRTGDKPAPSGSRLNFNPLHPSMELPPEQLIRLLGMESKKTRKSTKPRHTPKQTPSATLPPADTQADSTPAPAKAQLQAVRPADCSIQYERCEPPQVFDNGRSGLLVPSLLVGVVAGIAISSYLFWYQPADTAVQKTPVPVVAKPPQKLQPKHQMVKRTPVPIAPVAPPATPAAPAAEQKMSAQENAAWQAAIETQEQRLSTAAEERLAERVSQLQKTSQQAELLPPAQVSDVSPVPAPEPVTAPEPITPQRDTLMQAVVPEPVTTPEPVTETVTPVDITPDAPPEITSATNSGTPLPAPIPAAVVTSDVQELPAEVIQIDANTLPVTPGAPTAVMPAPVEATPESNNEATDEIPDIEPAAVKPVASDVEAEATPPTEANSVQMPVAPAVELPAASTGNDLI